MTSSRRVRFLAVTVLTVGTVGCAGSLFNLPFLGGGERVIQNHARLERLTTVAPIVGQYRLSSLGTAGLDAGEVARSTPSNVSGDLCYAHLSLGDLGPGMFPMTWLAPPDSFPDGPSRGTFSTVTFDLSKPGTIPSKIKIPADEGQMPAAKKIIRAELAFNYLDTTFEAGSPVVTYTVRTVYASKATAPDVTGTMQVGDLLIRLPGETAFKWANAAGTSTTREAVSEGILKDKTVSEYVHPPEGNPDYVLVTANFREPLQVTYPLISDTEKVWTLSFDLTNAIAWKADPTGLSTPQAVLGAFHLKFGPNQSTTRGRTDDGMRAGLTIQ